MKNKLSDLNNHLFEAMERLNNEDLTDEELEKEIKRSKAMEGIAKTIIDSGNLALQARKHLAQYGAEDTVELPLLGVTSKWAFEENQKLREENKNLREKVKKMEMW